MANPFGDNMFNPSPEYGDVARQTELLREAPISGAPTPGAAAPAAPAAPAAGPRAPTGPVPTAPAPVPVALPNVEYYQRMANTWRALAQLPGASDEVKAMAREARARQKAHLQIMQRLAG